MNRHVIIYPWDDPIIDTTGHDPRSLYVETFWLPTLGPTALLLLRHLATIFERNASPHEFVVGELSTHLGLGSRDGTYSPIMRSFERLVQFTLGCHGFRRGGPEEFAIRRNVPTVNNRHLHRLPEQLQQIHKVWLEAETADSMLEVARRRSRRMAAVLLAQGETVDDIEHALGAAGFHPSLCRSSAQWAWGQLHELSNTTAVG